MKHHHKRHMSHHRADGGTVPPHVGQGSGDYKHGGHVHGHHGHKHRHKIHKARGGALADHQDVRDEEGGKKGHTDQVPPLVSGNPVVVKAAKETKSIGEVPGIYAKKRLDRKSRAGGYDAESLVKK